MSDARKTPQEIRAENRKSWWQDIKNIGVLLGVVGALAALVGSCTNWIIKWDKVVLKPDMHQSHAKMKEETTKEIETERKAAEKIVYREIEVLRAEMQAGDASNAKDIGYIKGGVDANGQRLEKMIDKIEQMSRRRY